MTLEHDDLGRSEANVSRVERLGSLDSCTVSDALDSMGIVGVAHGLTRQSGAGRLAGVAVTMAVGEGDPPLGPPRHLGVNAIELANAGEVIVVSNTSDVVAGCWGGLLIRSAMAKGIGGVIAHGLVRDIDEANDLGFPIYSKGSTARTARGRIVERNTNEPVEVGGITVAPGDYVLADGSGVVFIPALYIDEVLSTAEAIATKEAGMVKAIEAGTPIAQVLGGNYENMLKSER